MYFFLRIGTAFGQVDPIPVSIDRNLLFPPGALSLPLAPYPAVESISPRSTCCSLPDTGLSLSSKGERGSAGSTLVFGTGHLRSMLWDLFCKGMSDLAILEVSIFGFSPALHRAIHDSLLTCCVFPVPIVFLSGCLGQPTLLPFKCRTLGFPVQFLVVFNVCTHSIWLSP